MEYAKYRKGQHWRWLRRAVFARDGWRCVKCRGRERLQCHHKFYRARFEDSVPGDCLTLCRVHHRLEHRHGKRARLRRVKKAVRLPLWIVTLELARMRALVSTADPIIGSARKEAPRHGRAS